MTSTTAKRTIPLLNLEALHAPLRNELIEEMTRVVDSQKFIMGEDVKQLEELVARYTGTAFAVGCASGSDALFLALLAIGIRPGDRVLTSSYTFFATAGAISRAGAVPVFLDIDPSTYNINPEEVSAALARDSSIRAVIPVHLFGACADMDPILEAAKRHNCAVIEDGAQAIGAEYRGRKAQSMGDIGCISFFPSKNLGGFGDGGMVTTDNADLAKKLAALRVHGSSKKYYHEQIGINSRLDTLQAAILKVKFRYLDAWTGARQKNADLYRKILAEASTPVVIPMSAAYQTRHVYNQFVIRHSKRDALRTWLKENGVGTEVYYPLPLHLQPCYSNLGYKEGDLPESERAAKESLALPIHSAMAEEDIAYVCQLIDAFCRNGERSA
jgi:dTDP-4-amino-4,6-dideoxygalactose transaminase